MEEHDGIKLTISGKEVPWWHVLDKKNIQSMISLRDSVWKKEVVMASGKDEDFEFLEDSWPPVVDGKLRAYNEYPPDKRKRTNLSRRYYMPEHDPTVMDVETFWKMKRKRGDIDDNDGDGSLSGSDEDAGIKVDMSTLSDIDFRRKEISESYSQDAGEHRNKDSTSS